MVGTIRLTVTCWDGHRAGIPAIFEVAELLSSALAFFVVNILNILNGFFSRILLYEHLKVCIIIKIDTLFF